MYNEHFGFSSKPFELSPDPYFLFLTETHREGLAHLKYGVLSDKGFVLLTGEVGTGKTTLLHSLLDELDDTVKVIFLANPVMTATEFRTFVGRKVGIKATENKAEFLLAMERALTQYSKYREKTILIVDEAQKLNTELMEEIRLLSNIETAKRKLITILLVGQPEVLELLSRDENRALRQRIGLRYHIKPLNTEETSEYINFRLAMAGSVGNGLFDQKAIQNVYSYSHGFPRLINILCDQALLTAFARGKRSVNANVIRECASELDFSADINHSTRSQPVTLQASSKIAWGDVAFVSLVVVLVLSIVLMILYRSHADWLESILRSIGF